MWKLFSDCKPPKNKKYFFGRCRQMVENLSPFLIQFVKFNFQKLNETFPMQLFHVFLSVFINLFRLYYRVFQSFYITLFCLYVCVFLSVFITFFCLYYRVFKSVFITLFRLYFCVFLSVFMTLFRMYFCVFLSVFITITLFRLYVWLWLPFLSYFCSFYFISNFDSWGQKRKVR